MSKTLIAAVAGAVVAFGASGANAQLPEDDLQFFVGGDTAVSIFQDYERPPGASVDDVDFSWSFNGGVRYKYAGVSAGYVDFGELHARAPALRDRVEYRGATLSGHGFLPLNEQLMLDAEAGVLFWQQDVDFTDAIGTFDAEADDASFLAGLGAAYQISPDFPLAVTMRYNRYFKVGDDDRTGHDNDIDRVGVGLRFAF